VASRRLSVIRNRRRRRCVTHRVSGKLMRKRRSRIECGSLYLWGALNDNSDLVEARFSSVRLFLPISCLFPRYNLSHKRNMKTTYEGSSLAASPLLIKMHRTVSLCRDRFFHRALISYCIQCKFSTDRTAREFQESCLLHRSRLILSILRC